MKILITFIGLFTYSVGSWACGGHRYVSPIEKAYDRYSHYNDEIGLFISSTKVQELIQSYGLELVEMDFDTEDEKQNSLEYEESTLNRIYPEKSLVDMAQNGSFKKLRDLTDLVSTDLNIKNKNGETALIKLAQTCPDSQGPQIYHYYKTYQSVGSLFPDDDEAVERTAQAEEIFQKYLLNAFQDEYKAKRKHNIERLIEKKAHLDAVDNKGFSALYYALKCESFDLAKSLLAAGASANIQVPINSVELSFFKDHPNNSTFKWPAEAFGYDPMSKVARVAKLPVNQLYLLALMKGERDFYHLIVNEFEPKPTGNEIYLAGFFGNKAVTSDLIGQGQKIDSPRTRLNPLEFSLFRENTDCDSAKLMIEHGAKITHAQKFFAGQILKCIDPSLMSLVESQNLNFAKIGTNLRTSALDLVFEAIDAKVGVRGHWGKSIAVTEKAVLAQGEKIILQLLRQGAPIFRDLEDRQSDLLSEAVLLAYADVVRVLIEDKNLKPVSHDNIYQLAMRAVSINKKQAVEILEILLRADLPIKVFNTVGSYYDFFRAADERQFESLIGHFVHLKFDLNHLESGKTMLDWFLDNPEMRSKADIYYKYGGRTAAELDESSASI